MESAFSMTSFLHSCLISLIVVPLLLLPSPSTANENNILVSGDVLYTDNQLSVNGTSLVIQDDCNLVVYGQDDSQAFQSDTHGRGVNCTLTLSNQGQLIIIDGRGNTVWTYGTPSGRTGEHAAILKPDGILGIFGPAEWVIPLRRDPTVADTKADSVNKNTQELTAPNLIFSSDVLNDGEKIVSRDYAFGVEKCTLKFTKGFETEWDYIPAIKGTDCFARLNHYGQLTLLDDYYRKLYETSPATAGEGIYVLVVTITGYAKIYGPQIWTT